MAATSFCSRALMRSASWSMLDVLLDVALEVASCAHTEPAVAHASNRNAPNLGQAFMRLFLLRFSVGQLEGDVNEASEIDRLAISTRWFELNLAGCCFFLLIKSIPKPADYAFHLHLP